MAAQLTIAAQEGATRRGFIHYAAHIGPAYPVFLHTIDKLTAESTGRYCARSYEPLNAGKVDTLGTLRVLFGFGTDCRPRHHLALSIFLSLLLFWFPSATILSALPPASPATDETLLVISKSPPGAVVGLVFATKGSTGGTTRTGVRFCHHPFEACGTRRAQTENDVVIRYGSVASCLSGAPTMVREKSASASPWEEGDSWLRIRGQQLCPQLTGPASSVLFRGTPE